MKRLAQLLVVGLLALLGAASCSSSTVGLPYLPSGESVAEVTGFASVPLTSSASGPVTVRITGTEAIRLALLVSQLPSIKQSQVICHEPWGLMYRIVFGGSVTQSKVVVEGYRCDAAVTVTVAGSPSAWGRDAACTLIRAVGQVLPARAKATQSLDIGCGS